MSDKEIEEVNLVFESGKTFELPEILGLVSKERKRDAKKKAKELSNDILKGIDVTQAVETHKDKKGRWLTITTPNCERCKFNSSDKAGRVYTCSHCAR